MLRIHNTLTRSKETFVPLEPGKVRMYVCGMTVYDFCHIGHARVLVVFDAVQRWLRASGYQLTYVRNVTDIDDKIIARARETGQSIGALTQRFIDAMHEDERALGVAPPDHEPRATGYVPQMLGLIERLEGNGYAYRAADGDVNYAVRQFARYGRLSGKTLDDLRSGERVAVTDAKHDPLDFVLWKSAKEGEPAEAKWESPFGLGRPGWHIECSAMSNALLGDTLDIHGGGADLQFPHHENEIAQSEGALFHNRDGQFVRYWMHNGFVRVDDEKMSKSLGNFFTIREVLRAFDPEVVRLFILRAHYRSPLNYSDAHLEDARQALLRLYTALSDDFVAARAGPGGIGLCTCSGREDDCTGSCDDPPPDAITTEFVTRFRAAMDDDFNTPEALAVLFDLATELNRTRAPVLERTLRSLAGVLGLLRKKPADARRSGLLGSEAEAAAGLDDAAIEAAIAARALAKQERNWAEADRIRDELTASNIVLEDSPGGTTWRRG